MKGSHGALANISIMGSPVYEVYRLEIFHSHEITRHG